MTDPRSLGTMDDYQVPKRRRLDYKLSLEDRRLEEQTIYCRQADPTPEQIEAEHSMSERSYGARIDMLPTDIRRELRKFICPYVLRYKGLSIILYFPGVKHTVKITCSGSNKFRLCRMLNTLSRSDLMIENVCYHEDMNYCDHWFFDRHTLRIHECWCYDKEFNLPIRPVLIDALTRACNAIYINFDPDDEEDEFEISKPYSPKRPRYS